jgi:peroxiredoxin
MVAGRPWAQHMVMTSSAATYNYPAFSFALEEGAYERFLHDAPQLGAVAPPFELPDLEGRHHRPVDWRGRPVVIEFGSYTCPIFFGHSPAMEAVATAHPEAAFVVVYTREAHPGEHVPAHATVADKTRAAHHLIADERIGRLVLVDDLDGTVHGVYGAVWDAVFVLDADGTVVLRRAWNDPAQVAAALQSLRAGEHVRVESTEMAPPASPAGFGHGLLRGGPQALLDFYQSAPPPVREGLEHSSSNAVRVVLDALASRR